MIDFGCDAVKAEVGVQGECQVECGSSGGQGNQFAFRGKDKNLGTEQVELDGIEKVDGIWLGVFKNVFNGL